MHEYVMDPTPKLLMATMTIKKLKVIRLNAVFLFFYDDYMRLKML